MPSKLKFYIKEDKKIYTLKEKVNGNPTSPAHYKFLKIKDVKESTPKTASSD